MDLKVDSGGSGYDQSQATVNEHSNEPLDTIKGRELLDQLSCCQLLKKNSAP
jgi:hypothetical protein